MSGLPFRIGLGYGLLALIMLAALLSTSRALDRVRATYERSSDLAASSQSATQLALVVSESERELSDWVLLKDEDAKARRAEIWSERVDPIAQRMRALNAGRPAGGSNALTPLLEELDRLRAAQASVAAIAHSAEDGPAPALRILLEGAMPLADLMVDSITEMIDLEKRHAASPERKQLLATLADFRGSLGLGLASLRGYLLSDSEQSAADFRRQWSINERALSEVLAARPLLTPDQHRALEHLTRERARFAPLPAEIFDTRRRVGSNLAIRRMRDEVTPLGDSIRRRSNRLASEAEAERDATFLRLGSLIDWTNQVERTVFGLGVAMCAILGFALTRMTTRPIRKAVAMANAIASGDLSHRVEIRGASEAEALGLALERMASNLESETGHRAQSEAQLRLIVESAPGMLMVNQQGEILLANRRLESTFGYQREEIVGEPIEMLLPEDVRAKHVLVRDAYLERPESREMGRGRDLFGRRKDGSGVSVEVGLTPVRFRDEICVLAVVTDITERKNAERAISEANLTLERSNHDLEQFAYVASHDLQEPLRKVSSFCSLLEKKYQDQLDDDGRSYIRFAVDGANRMQILVQDLLSYSRMQSTEVSNALIDANEAFRVAAEQLGVSIEESGTEIHCEALPQVWADARQLAQLFQNLIGNAIKYRSEEPPRIRVFAERAAREWVFTVADNGMGIDPKYHEKVFGIFKRLHTKEEYPGTGIGLAICRRIAERLGGRIWVESEAGTGSRFRFSIPDRAPQTSHGMTEKADDRTGRSGDLAELRDAESSGHPPRRE